MRCRVAMGGGLARDTGVVSGSAVTWSQKREDGTVSEARDVARLDGGKLLLESEQGTLTLRRTRGVPPACEPIFN